MKSMTGFLTILKYYGTKKECLQLLMRLNKQPGLLIYLKYLKDSDLIADGPIEHALHKEFIKDIHSFDKNLRTTDKYLIE